MKRLAISIGAGLAPFALLAALIRWPSLNFALLVAAALTLFWMIARAAYDALE